MALGDNLAVVGEIASLVLVSMGAFTLRLSIRKDRELKIASDAVLVETVQALKIKLDNETGDNNNGLRQKLNEHAAFVTERFVEVRATQLKIEEKAAKTDEKIDKLSNGLSEVRGALDERARRG